MAQKNSSSYQSYYTELVRALVRLVEESDSFLKGHSERVASYCSRFFKKLGLPKRELQKVYLAGLLHDIGMVYLPPDLVNKPGNLTDDELKLIQMHPVVAETILSQVSVLKGVIPLIRHHHESYDGSGYPDGLQGNDIPLGARIIAVMDSFCAMTADRPHRKALGNEEALAEIEKDSGVRYDPKLVKGFLQLVRPQSAAAASGAPAGTSEESGEQLDEAGLAQAIQDIIAKFKRGQITLPVLPNIIHQIQKVINNPMATTAELARVIEKDSVISLKLISTANSSLYRGTKKIETVADAVPRLGLKQTQSLVNALANKDLYNTKNEECKNLMEQMWQHSLASAYTSRAIAKQLRMEDIEKFFLLGLIHDIGKVLLLKALTEAVLRQKNGGSFKIDDVIKVMQDAHTSFGGALLERWGFGKEYKSVAIQHEGANVSKDTPQEVLVVHLANMLTRSIGYSVFNDEELDAASLESAKILEIDAESLAAIREEIKQIMLDSKKAF